MSRTYEQLEPVISALDERISAKAEQIDTLDTRVTDVGDALATKADADEIGDLSQLTTTAKDNLVSAINEANEAVTGINGRLDDTNAETTDIRVGADGTTYASAGAAVRGQITDVKEDIDDYFIVGKNLFHGVFENAKLNSSGVYTTVGVNPTRNTACAEYFPVDNSETYTLSCSSMTVNSTQTYIHEYASDKTFIKSTNLNTFGTGIPVTITVGPTTKFIRISLYGTSASTAYTDVVPVDFQIEKGSIPTQYEAYRVINPLHIHPEALTDLLGLDEYVGKQDFDALRNIGTYLSQALTKGSISQVNGADSANDYYYRTSYIPTTEISSVTVDDTTNYYAKVLYYNSDYSYTSAYYDSIMANPIVINKTYAYVRVIGRLIDGTISESAWREHIKPIYTIESNLIDTVNKTIAGNGDIPDYWLTYLDAKKANIVSAIAGIGINGDCFQFITDYHYPSNQRKSPALLRYIHKMGIKRVINGGDILNKHTYADALSTLEDYRMDMKDLAFFSVDGNHENNPYKTENDVFNDNENYVFLYEDVEHSPVVWGIGKNYYYDNVKQKIRYIFCGNYDMTNDDADWLEDVLNGITDNDYRVVVFVHSIFNLSSQDPITITRTTQGVYVERLCDAYNGRTTVSFYGGSWDFTNAHGKIACIICGHIHMDYYEQSTAGYPIIATICDCNASNQQVPTSVVRQNGTSDEQAFDLFFINTVDKTINTVRIGYGSDRSFTFT